MILNSWLGHFSRKVDECLKLIFLLDCKVDFNGKQPQDSPGEICCNYCS